MNTKTQKQLVAKEFGIPKEQIDTINLSKVAAYRAYLKTPIAQLNTFLNNLDAERIAADRKLGETFMRKKIKKLLTVAVAILIALSFAIGVPYSISAQEPPKPIIKDTIVSTPEVIVLTAILPNGKQVTVVVFKGRLAKNLFEATKEATGESNTYFYYEEDNIIVILDLSIDA